jgi:ABC-type branched-subunit amino acid transport system substrate-binding protein
VTHFIKNLGVFAALILAACGGAEDAAAPDAAPDAPTLQTDKGVDAAAKVIKIGTLNDESGPAAAVGKPFAIGKRLLAANINAGGSGLLPEGWTVELIERDHGYNPQKSVQSFNEIKDDVLFIGTSFGTPNTLPLRPHLEKENMVAFPASLSSDMAANKFTPPLGPSYVIEARRAMDWVVASAGGADKVKAGIVYQQDDYGKDGLKGWKQAAKQHGVEIVSEQTIAPGQKDMTAVVTGLKDAGATHVLLTILPSGTGPVVGTAAQLKYMPVWVGNTPAWIDGFFKPEVIPSAVFANYHQINGLPYWGEEVNGMDKFLAAWDTHGKDMGNADFYILMSYVQGLIQIEAANKAIANGDITRAGYFTAMTSIDGWDNGGMLQPVTLTGTPYVTGTRTRILKPDFEKKSWTVVAAYAEVAAAAVPAAKKGVSAKRKKKK